jgi:very-short-patch-repair endonuclease
MDRDLQVAEVAARQHALVTYAQARAAGLGDHGIVLRLRSGRWRRIRRGVFAIAGAPATWEQSVLAAVLEAGPGAVASHATAAAIWGLPGVDRERIEITTDRPHWSRVRGVRSHRTVAWLAAEHTLRHDIAVTTVARTIVDLSGRFGVAALGRITDHGLRHGYLLLDELRKCVGGLPSAPGRRPSRVHAVLRRRLKGYQPGESDLETRFARALVAGGLPEPIQQHRIRVANRRYRLDLAYPDQRVAIEIDGWEPHRGRSAFDSDRVRANHLVASGWNLLRFTSAMTDEEAVAATTQLRAALEHNPAASGG